MNVEVLVELNVDKTFTYKVPTNMKKDIEIGKRVLVPFGQKNLEGFILNVHNDEVSYKVKDIIKIIDDRPVLNKEFIELGKYMTEKYLATKVNVYQSMLPVGLKAKQKRDIKKKKISYIVINQPSDVVEEYIDSNVRYNRQIEILDLLKTEDEVLKSEISGSSLNTLIKKGLVKEKKTDSYRIVRKGYEKNERFDLTEDQRKVFDVVKEGLDKKGIYLLHGITGSGKTEVYMYLIEEVIKKGQQAIMLVPEISLTEQMISRFIGRFGDDVAVLHSSLSVGEKFDEWRKIVNKDVNIVVGARSAIFAPFTDIGIIIIDEEHEHTYKSEQNPKYHARDIAKWRGEHHNCPVLLGSATPSLESYARAKKGVYKLLELKQRIGEAVLPLINIVSMSDEYKKGNRSIFSTKLKTLIEDRLQKNEQVILLLNRRGYNNYLNCNSCGYVMKCPKCDITLTYHKNSDTMKCHYCDYVRPRMIKCPECGSSDIKGYGYGTQKLEEEIEKTFGARVIRMDRDTTSKKNSHQRILNDFKNHKYDILLGTQMIAKGLDFPLVTLVGVINADGSLNIPDFRSAERTYQLLSQVSGRAGRRSNKGEVVIQTFNPDHYSISMTKEHDYLSFYLKEMDIRKRLGYSPYYFISSIKIVGKNIVNLEKVAKKISNYLRKSLSNGIIVLGPTVMNPFKINNVYRFMIVLKYKDEEKIRGSLKQVLEHFNNSNIKIDIDIDTLRM